MEHKPKHFSTKKANINFGTYWFKNNDSKKIAEICEDCRILGNCGVCGEIVGIDSPSLV